ncbi:MAG: DapH/DapD/GlmU-related protein [Blastocatellales bacterium]
MKRTLYLCGAGNSEGVRLALTVNRNAQRWERIVLLDDDPAKHGIEILGVRIAGCIDSLGEADPESDEVVNLVARTTDRRWMVRNRIEQFGIPFAALIHPLVETDGASLPSDAIAYRNSTIGSLSSMGTGSVAFMGAIVGHGATLGNGCIVAPNGVINARVRVGDGVYIGSNASILPELSIGDWTTIAANTVVTQDIPAGSTVLGVPGKVVLTLEMKLRMRAFRNLPQAVQRDLEQRIKPAA